MRRFTEIYRSFQLTMMRANKAHIDRQQSKEGRAWPNIENGRHNDGYCHQLDFQIREKSLGDQEVSVLDDKTDVGNIDRGKVKLFRDTLSL